MGYIKLGIIHLPCSSDLYIIERVIVEGDNYLAVSAIVQLYRNIVTRLLSA
jgi:hypothetical protein